MTDDTPTPAPSRNAKRKLVPQKIGSADKRRHPRGLTRKIRIAIDAIVFDRCSRSEACQKAEITERALYLALEKVEVAAYWRKQIEVLRTGESAANIHALVDVRGGKNEMARVKSVQVLEQLNDEPGMPSGKVPTTPGIVIIVQQGALPAAPSTVPMVDVTPAEPVTEPPTPSAFDSRRLAPRNVPAAPRQRFLDYDK